MIGNIYEFQDLQRLCDPDAVKKGAPPRRATVEAWAQKQRIPFRYDRNGGIWTTIEAVNAALGLRASNDAEHYGAEDV